MLAFLLVSKMVATTASVTSGARVACSRRRCSWARRWAGMAGNLVHHVFPDATGGASSYALVGMGAVLAATTHAPMTATVLIAELTGDYFVVLPQLLACSLAATLTYRMDSVYTRELRRAASAGPARSSRRSSTR
jgi:CIC family chloride channel protein